MAVITTGAHPKALWPGIQAWFGRKYNEYPTQWTDLFDRVTSDTPKGYEEDVETTGFGLAAIKAEGAATTYDTEAQGFTKRYTHVVYSLGYIVTKEELEDNLYESVSKTRSEALAFSFRQTKEINLANIYNRAFNSSYTGGDAKELLATDHPSLAGSWSNELATPADLSEASIEDLVIQIMGATNSRGLRIALQPQSLHVHRSNWFEANRILKSVLQNDTANNAINVLRAEGTFPKGIKLNQFFDDADAWFIRTNCPNGMKYIERRPLSFTTDNDFDTSNAKAKADERYSAGWTDPRALYGSAGA